MIITRTPLRISFVGGGSDLPSFYQEEPGAVVSATINKFVYVTVSEKFDGSIRAAYRETENVDRIDALQHDLIRETLRLRGPHQGVEIHSIADIPGGTGLGSSSAFTVGLIKALTPHLDPRVLADTACAVEIDMCGHQIGKQDQYAAAFGGVNLLRFRADGYVEQQRIACDTEALSAHLLLLYTGQIRQGDAGQQQKPDRDDVRGLAHLAQEFTRWLERGSYPACGDVMHDAWEIKRRSCSNAQIDAWYAAARAAGAWGGKLCGAGGGGFLAFLAPPDRHQAIVRSTGLRHVSVRIGVPGCEVVYR